MDGIDPCAEQLATVSDPLLTILFSEWTSHIYASSQTETRYATEDTIDT